MDDLSLCVTNSNGLCARVWSIENVQETKAPWGFFVFFLHHLRNLSRLLFNISLRFTLILLALY